jgi:UDP-N-acetylglucosamine--N-acetylmuramyl-(pentapeptide) pyrophosphoryl-undecaprenol N-acetylglucosamine transferase
MGYPQGGHVYPAIAIADALAKASGGREVEVHFAGTKHRMEWTAVPKAGYPIHAVPAFSLQRKTFSLNNILLPFR